MIFRYQTRGRIYAITLERHSNTYQAVIDDTLYHFKVLDFQEGELDIMLDGMITRLFWATDGEKKWICMDGCTYLIEKPLPRLSKDNVVTATETILRAPMPAQVISIDVQAGDEVSKGQTLLRLEAMKMELRIQAEQDGRVSKLFVEEGQIVMREQPLVEIRPQIKSAHHPNVER